MRTIRSGREMDEMFREGTRVTHQLATALIRHTPPGRGPGGRVAFVAGKKLGNAVMRNRSKRVLRAAVRRSGGPWAGTDVVLIARPGTAHATPDRLDEAILAIVRRVGALC